MLVLLLNLFIFIGCSSSSKTTKPIVSVSTFAIYDITKNIAGSSIELVNILPAGVSPHSFEPTPKLMAKIEKSSLVIFSGGLEPWTSAFHFKHNTLNISQYVTLRKLHKNEEHEEHESHHHKGSFDPHYWLNIENMKKATKIITQKLIEVAPKNKTLYEKNEKIYLSMLENLEKNFDTSLKECKYDTLVSNHNAFSYIASRYNFKTATLSGLSPQSMPSPKKIVQLMKRIKKDNIKTIFFESFANEKVIRSIAHDTKINVDVLHPLGNITAIQLKNNESYEKIMRENLSKISKALQCQ